MLNSLEKVVESSTFLSPFFLPLWNRVSVCSAIAFISVDIEGERNLHNFFGLLSLLRCDVDSTTKLSSSRKKSEMKFISWQLSIVYLWSPNVLVCSSPSIKRFDNISSLKPHQFSEHEIYFSSIGVAHRETVF